MRRLRPGIRLREYARAIVARYPDPPRPVTVADVCWIYAPVIGYLAFVVVVVSALYALRSHSTSGLGLIVGILLVGASST